MIILVWVPGEPEMQSLSTSLIRNVLTILEHFGFRIVGKGWLTYFKSKDNKQVIMFFNVDESKST